MITAAFLLFEKNASLFKKCKSAKDIEFTLKICGLFVFLKKRNNLFSKELMNLIPQILFKKFMKKAINFL